MVRQQADFTLERETKGTVRYQEITQLGKEDSYLIGTLYLRKAALREAGAEGWPQRLTVTVED
jgi:hypothetical protein